VPGAGSVTAVAPHDHSISKTTGPTTSENTGALIRIGWVTQYLNARLFVRDSNPTPAHPLFVPFYWSPVYIPPGTDSVMVGMICPDISGEFKDRRAARFRLRVYDSSINEMPNSPTTFRDATINDVFYLGGSSGFDFLISKIGSSTIDFKAGGVFLFRIDCWDGLTMNQWNDSDNDNTLKSNFVNSVLIAPLKDKPLDVPYRYDEPTTTTNNIKTPLEYLPVEDDMVQTDRSMNSAVMTFAGRNDPLLQEVTHGRPAGNGREVDLLHSGHNHADWDLGSSPARGGTTGLDDSGLDLSWNLGSWSYGTLRPRANTAAGGEFADEDCIFSGGTGAPFTPNPRSVWGGKIVAPTLDRRNQWCTVSVHTFRLPAATDVNIGLAAGTTKIKAAVFGWLEGAPQNELQMRVEIFDKDGANGGGAVQVNKTADGREVVDFSDLECSTNATGDGDIQKVRLQIRKTRNGDKASVYGITLYYEA